MSYARHPMVKPEDAIKRVDELVSQGQTKLAIEKLQEVFRMKRGKQWTEKHEAAMMKLVDLSITQRRNLKDDLMGYRQFSREVKENTVERVLFHVVSASEEQTAKAEESKETKVEEVCNDDDIDDESPEAILMKAVSGEEVKDRISRELLHPWLRYQIECYKSCMEVCIKLPDYEDTFHKLASKAFHFCKRKAQRLAFRNNFCRLIREHWTSMSSLPREKRDRIREQVKNEQTPKPGIPIAPNTKFNLMIQAHLDQLEVAVHFDNWQDAYRAIEEIHMKMSYFKVVPKMETMVTYYSMLAQIFWVSRNFLFHAFAVQRIYKNKENEVVEKKKEAQDKEDKRRMADKVILAILCIPYWAQDRATCVTPFTVDMQREKAEKMTKLLKSQAAPPTRESLLAELKTSQVFRIAHPEVVDLYNLIERNVQPLTLATKVGPLFEWLEANDLGNYTTQLKEVAAISVIISSSKVYSTLALKALRDMCSFYSDMDLESLLVTVARAPNSSVGLCIDHQSAAIRFSDANISSDILSSTLPSMRSRLAEVNRMLAKRDELEKRDLNVTAQQDLLLKRVANFRDQERASIVQRMDIIAKKRVRAEEEERKANREKLEKLAEQQQQQVNEEMKKKEEERKRRELVAKEEASKRQSEEKTQVVIRALQESELGIKTTAIENRLKKGEKMDTDELMEQSKRLMIEAKHKAEQKRLKEWHAVHWLERAMREAEAPLIRANHAKRIDELQQAYEARKLNTIAQMKKDWEEAHATKVRMDRIHPFMDEFFSQVMSARYVDPAMIKRAEKAIDDEDAEEELMVKANRKPAASSAGAAAPAGAAATKSVTIAEPSEAMESGNWRGGGGSAAPAAAAPAETPEPEKKAAWRPGMGKAKAAEAAAPAPAPESPKEEKTEEADKPKKWVPPSQRSREGGGGFKMSM